MNCPNCNADDLKATVCGSPGCPQTHCRECGWGCDLEIEHGRCVSSQASQRIPSDWDPSIKSAIIKLVDSIEEAALGKRAERIRIGERTPIDPRVRRAVFMRDHFMCQNCSRHVDSTMVAHLDHIIPWSAGGPDTSENLRVLCADCNETRSNYRGPMDHQRKMPIALGCVHCMGASVDWGSEVQAWCAQCYRPSTTYTIFVR